MALMIPVKSLPPLARSAVTIDPGANGGWALWYKLSDQTGWVLYQCGLARPDKGERPAGVKGRGLGLCVLEVPQHQHGDTPKRTNDLFKTTLRAGLLAESTQARELWVRSPHDWKGGVDKAVHNGRVMKRLSKEELDLIGSCRTGAGGLVPASLINNVIVAIGLGLVSLGRW